MKPAGYISLRTSIVLPAVAAVIIAAVLGVRYVRVAKERSLNELFAGLCEISEEPRWESYPRCVYDLRDYKRQVLSERLPSGILPAMLRPPAPEKRGLERLYGEAGEKLEALMRRRRVDAITAATAVVRLRSPTVYRERRPSRRLWISYPPEGAVFPPNLCEPCVEWDDTVNDLWQVTVGISGTPLRWVSLTAEKRWWFPRKVWRTLREKAVENWAWIQVKGICRDSVDSPSHVVQASQIVHFRISRWPADDAIVYRLVAPPFNSRRTPDTFVRDIRSFKTYPFLKGHESYCFNCHTFSSKDGVSGKLSIQARYLRGGRKLPVYVGICDIRRRRGWRVRLPFAIQMTTFMAWSPDGEKLAFSANQQLAAISPIVHETQLVGEPTSDIAIYDISKNIAYLLPGASAPDSLEIYPFWSPDGRYIVFCSAPSGVFPAFTRYDLRIVPFNDGRGGPSKPVPGASNDGMSNYFPRFSPDGRWLVFCKSNGGSLIKPSSDLYILPGDLKGPARRLECNSDYAADSWHSWSSNSRWLVFASKRDDGIYARLYLTQIDDEGHASPAVRLPLKREPLTSFNIPEFVAQRPPIRESDLYEAIRVERSAVAIQGRERE